jgi:hypothetical protein
VAQIELRFALVWLRGPCHLPVGSPGDSSSREPFDPHR